MKIDARRAATLLRDPASVRVVFLYGEDSGLIRSRGDQLTRGVVGSLDDPFRVVALNREDHDRLAEEATALSMIGGRRIVRVREVSDALTPIVGMLADKPLECLLVLEAPTMPARSKLRTLAEAHDQIASIPCYPEEGRGLEAAIGSILGESGVRIEREALTWVASQLGADQALTRREVEKLALYCGQVGIADLQAAQACIGDATSASLDDALFAATRGDIASTDRALGRARAEGLAPVALLRATLSHLQKLQIGLLAVAAGHTPAEAMRSARPPIFFRRQGDYVRALEICTFGLVKACMEVAMNAEQSCKTTGVPDDALSAHVLFVLAGRAAQAALRYERSSKAIRPSSWSSDR